MATIIFATDFSPVAQHAATYAAHLAQYLKKELLLLHAYIIPFNYADSAIPLLNAEEVRDIATNSIEAEEKRLRQLEPELTIEGKITAGDLIDCLHDEINENQPELIILGTSGDDADSILWGSMAVKALRSFKIPVLTIPSKASWKPISKIAFAADYNKVSENTPFPLILEWFSKMKAQLSIVHIDNPTNETIKPPDILQKAFKSDLVTYHSVSTENIVEGVQEFVQLNQIDWLILIPRKYGFWGSLFHKSRTKMLAQVSHIPILSIHQD